MTAPGDPQDYARRSARVLVLDQDDQVLLFHCWVDVRRHRKGTFWVPPGGGVEDGEPLVEAAVRELREETGLAVGTAELVGPVAESAGPASFPGWLSGQFQDNYFFLRVGEHEVDSSGWTPMETQAIVDHWWWPITDLATTDDVVVPLELAPLLTDLLAGRIPYEPVRLPWYRA